MRILITDFFGIMAGSSYSAYYLAIELEKKGHVVWFAYKEGSFLENLVSKDSRIKGVSFLHTGKFNLSNAKRLSKIVAENKIQIVNAQASPDRYTSIFARWLFAMPGKLFHTRRQKPETTGGRVKAWFYTKGTDGIIAVSPAVKEQLRRSGIPQEHIETVMNGIPTSKFQSPDPQKVHELRLKYQLKDDDFVIGCVSRIKKQHQILLAAAKLPFPVKIIFVGIADKYADLKAIIDTLHSGHRVYFTGELSNEEVLNHYPLFKVKVLPSDMEGLSQSLLEAMSLKVPVIATNLSGNPDLIEHGVNGLLFEDHDIEDLSKLLGRVQSDSQLVQELTKNAFEQVSKDFRMEYVIESYEKLFKEMIEK